MRTNRIAEVLERQLAKEKQPYISVDEAKRALFQGAKLKAFHFVVYRPAGVNFLVFCGERRAVDVTDMRQWQEIFGAGFQSLFAMERAGVVVFRDLEGEPFEGQVVAGPISVPPAPSASPKQKRVLPQPEPAGVPRHGGPTPPIASPPAQAFLFAGLT